MMALRRLNRHARATSQRLRQRFKEAIELHRHHHAPAGIELILILSPDPAVPQGVDHDESVDGLAAFKSLTDVLVG